jgi:PAS domain S-box-containing protein
LMKKLGITPKLTLIFVLFAGAVLVGLGIPAYNNGRTALEAATVSELLSTAMEKQAALDSWVADRQHSIGDIANQGQLQETVTALIAAAPGSADARRLHADLVRQLGNWAGGVHRFLSLEVIDAATGRVLAATEAIEEGKFREEQPYFINGLQAGYVQNPYYDLARQRPSMTAAAPILSSDGQVIAVLAGPLNLDEMNVIIQRRSGLHQTDDAFLVNTSNLFVTQPRLNLDPAVLQRGIHTEAVNLCLAHKNGVAVAPDYRDIPAFIVYRWLPERQLCLITKLDQAEAYTPARALASTMGLIGGLVLLLGSIVAFGMSRSITRPVQQLVQGAAEIGRGNLEYRIAMQAKDEIGQLAGAFDQMTEHLQKTLVSRDDLLAEIAERKRAEETLHQSEEKYRHLFQNAQVGMYRSKLDGSGILAVNQKLCEIFGFSEEEMISNPATIRWANPTARDQMVADLRRTGSLHDYEMSILTKKGEVRNCLVSISLNPELGYLEGSAIDITERKQAEQALHETNEYLENLIDYANAPIIVWDPQFKITRFNHAFETLTGRSSAEVLGKPVAILFPPAQIKASMKLIRKTLTGERWEGVEIGILRLGGSIRIVLWNSTTLFSVDGKIPIATIAQGRISPSESGRRTICASRTRCSRMRSLLRALPTPRRCAPTATPHSCACGVTPPGSRRSATASTRSLPTQQKRYQSSKRWVRTGSGKASSLRSGWTEKPS